MACHVKVNHKAFLHTEMQCNFTSCSRRFQNVYSLITHLHKNHSMSKDVRLQLDQSALSEDTNLINICSNIDKQPITLENLLSLCSLYVESNAEDTLTYENCKIIVQHGAALLIAKMYATGNMNRNLIHNIIDSIRTFYNSVCLGILKKHVETNSTVWNMIQIIEHVFDNFKSEHVTFKYLKDKEYLFLPSIITINTHIRIGNVRAMKKLKIHRSKIAIIPLKQILRKFLELPKVYDSIISNLKKKIDTSEAIFTGEMWSTTNYIYKIR